ERRASQAGTDRRNDCGVHGEGLPQGCAPGGTAHRGCVGTVVDLLALRGHPPEADANSAEAVARDVYGLSARATPLEGERDRNFRLETADGQRLVLKFIDHEADDVVVTGQSAVLAHLAEQNPQLPVPRVIRTRTGADLAAVRLDSGGNEDLTCRV